MVNISKWALLGIGIITASLFFREAAATTLTGTLSRTGLAGAEIGTGINKTLTGLGSGSARLIDPLFSLVDLFGKTQTLFEPSGTGRNSNEVGGGFNQDNNAGGGIQASNIPTSLAGVSASNGGGTTVTSSAISGAGSWSSAAKKATGVSFSGGGSNWG